ncbi:MAG TPA: methyltransferase domain-containing protein [Pseudonocardia sp.]
MVQPSEQTHGHGHGHRHDDVDPAQFFGREYWDERYGGEQVWSGNPNPLLVSYAADLQPGTALDVGSGEGADVLWLASRGWTVTGVDISEVALRRCAELAEQAGAEVAARITWQQADLLTWAPEPGRFDLISVQFIHLPGPMRESLHRRLAAAVHQGGTLLVVSHHPADLEIDSMQRPHLPDMFATAEQMATVLDPAQWDIETAAPQREATDPEGNVVTIRDAVLRAVRR